MKNFLFLKFEVHVREQKNLNISRFDPGTAFQSPIKVCGVTGESFLSVRQPVKH